MGKDTRRWGLVFVDAADDVIGQRVDLSEHFTMRTTDVECPYVDHHVSAIDCVTPSIAERVLRVHQGAAVQTVSGANRKRCNR